MDALSRRLPWACVFVLSLALAALLGRTASAGPLDPAAAPASTMKTLDQVEPRTAISSLPYTISQGGSYYVTGNLQPPAGQGGIEISATNVTVDLLGFTLRGTGGVGTGVRVLSGADITIRNGSVEGWAANGNSVEVGSVDRVIVEDVRASANVGSGIHTGRRSVVRNCFVVGNHQHGIFVDQSFSLDLQSAIVEGNVAHANAADGIRTIGSALVTNNESTRNLNGIHLLGNGGSRVEGNNAASNTGTGLLVDTASSLIVRNSVANHGTAYNIVAGNAVGPIESAATPLTNPWANIEY